MKKYQIRLASFAGGYIVGALLSVWADSSTRFEASRG